MTARQPSKDLSGSDSYDGALWEFIAHGEGVWEHLVERRSVPSAWTKVCELDEGDLRAVILYRLWVNELLD